MLKNLKHEKEFDTQTLFTDTVPLMEDTKETIDRKALTDTDVKSSEGRKTQVYEPRPLTPDDDIYEDIIEQFATAPTKPKYWFEEFGDYWSCSCGHINKGEICKSCGLERKLLRSLFILHKPVEENRLKQREAAEGNKTKPFNKKIIIAIAACVCLIPAGGAGLYLTMSPSMQDEPLQKLQTQSLVSDDLLIQTAALWPDDMTALKNSVNAGKFAYVQKKLSGGDPQAETYMAQLMTDKYPGIQEIYDEYYAWEVNIVANRSENDFDTDLETVSRRDTVYFHATLSGGAPEEIIELYYEVTWPNGSSEIYGLDSIWQAGSRITARFQYPIPLFGTEGQLTFNLYNKKTGELMGTDTVIFKH